MQNSSGFDFSKILDQTLYTYTPEKNKNMDEAPENLNSGVAENGINTKLGLVDRLRPMVELIAISEMIVGSITLIFLGMMAYEYDKMYATEDTGLISFMCFVGLLFLIVNGMMLLTSLKMEKKKILGFYLWLSTLLWIYIFGLSVMKIHYALVVIENNANKAVLPEARHFLLSNACIMGVVTMLGSVIHFIGNVCVFTYYNLKYVQPIMLDCGP